MTDIKTKMNFQPLRRVSRGRMRTQRCMCAVRVHIVKYDNSRSLLFTRSYQFWPLEVAVGSLVKLFTRSTFEMGQRENLGSQQIGQDIAIRSTFFHFGPQKYVIHEYRNKCFAVNVWIWQTKPIIALFLSKSCVIVVYFPLSLHFNDYCRPHLITDRMFRRMSTDWQWTKKKILYLSLTPSLAL